MKINIKPPQIKSIQIKPYRLETPNKITQQITERQNEIREILKNSSDTRKELIKELVDEEKRKQKEKAQRVTMAKYNMGFDNTIFKNKK